MLASNTIRFTTDTFGEAVEFTDEPIEQPIVSFVKKALLVSKVPLDCSKKSAVTRILVTGSAPTNSKRRVIFKIDGSLYKFSGSQLVPYSGEGLFDDVINNGNPAGGLNDLSNIAAFVGKKIYPIIALQAPADAEEFPTIKIALVTQSDSQQLNDTQDTPVYVLAEEAQTITDITPLINITDGGDVQITVRLRKDDEWSSFMLLSDAVYRLADAVQFRIKYSVENIGSDSAQVQSITVSHHLGQAVVSGDVANIYSLVQSYDVGLKTCYLIVHHAPLVDAKIEGYANFMTPPKRRELIQIGTGSGARKEYTLGVDSVGDSNIVADSIRLFVNGEPFYNFDFSTETASVTLSAKSGAVIAASYDYDYGQENWLAMTPEPSQPYNDDLGSYATRFTYQLPDDVNDRTIANVRVLLFRKSGSATENLGTATGKTQLFTLKHKPKPSTISFAGNVNHSYDETTGILSVVAAKNSALNVSYNYRGDAPVVYSFAAGFSVA